MKLSTCCFYPIHPVRLLYALLQSGKRLRMNPPYRVITFASYRELRFWKRTRCLYLEAFDILILNMVGIQKPHFPTTTSVVLFDKSDHRKRVVANQNSRLSITSQITMFLLERHRSAFARIKFTICNGRRSPPDRNIHEYRLE